MFAYFGLCMIWMEFSFILTDVLYCVWLDNVNIPDCVLMSPQTNIEIGDPYLFPRV